MVSDAEVRSLAARFRGNIEKARDAGFFHGDVFDGYPNDCCGDTSVMLAEFLRCNCIETIIVSGEDNNRQTHAWLVVKDSRVSVPQRRYFDGPDNIKGIWNAYRGCSKDATIDITHYNEDDIAGGLIIDITADQFGEPSLYVGYIDSFHRQFTFRSASDCFGSLDIRLIGLYRKILCTT